MYLLEVRYLLCSSNQIIHAVDHLGKEERSRLSFNNLEFPFLLFYLCLSIHYLIVYLTHINVCIL
jgi:hypothetical protein